MRQVKDIHGNTKRNDMSTTLQLVTERNKLELRLRRESAKADKIIKSYNLPPSAIEAIRSKATSIKQRIEAINRILPRKAVSVSFGGKVGAYFDNEDKYGWVVPFYSAEEIEKEWEND
jgi:hypothetical protein